MYVWTCTKENLSCNLTCYNVQNVCIVFDWGNFYAERNIWFICTHISDLYLYCVIPDLCSLRPPGRCLKCKTTGRCAALLSVLWFDSAVWLIVVEVTTKLMFYGVMTYSGLVHSCFSLKLPYIVTEAMLLLFCIKSYFSSIKLGDIWVRQQHQPYYVLFNLCLNMWLGRNSISRCVGLCDLLCKHR